ncbi:MAG: S8 family serine peptidase, partial [Phycisphaerales bacterium]
MNYSAGGSLYHSAMAGALLAARDAGVLFVASAGNDSRDTDVTPYYPAGYNVENVIAVAATDHTDALAEFSNWGATSVDLGAPGVDVLSTLPAFATLFLEDFQAATPPDIGGQFTLEGPVNYWGTVDIGEGQIVARGDAEQSNPYRPNADGWIVSPPIDTTGQRALVLNYQRHCEIEDADDALIVEIWDGTGWLELARRSASECNGGPWSNVVSDLEPYRNPSMQLRYGWQTDGDSNDSLGAEVDNIQLKQSGTDYTVDTVYGFKNGTSMAAPHVVGAAALLLADRPDMCLTELRNRLILSGDPVAALDGITVSGTRLNVYRALTAASGLSALTPNGGEHWFLGTSHTLLWSVFECDPPNTVDIYLLKGGSALGTLAADVPNTGTFRWSIPMSLPKGTDYRIRFDNGTEVDESDDDFTIWSSFLHVDDDAPEGGDGLTWSSAFDYLQDALAAATDGSRILVAGGTYKPDLDTGGIVVPGDREATFLLKEGVRMYGGFAGLANPDDPNLRDLEQYESILSGDLTGDDGPYHVEEFATCFSGSGVQFQPGCDPFDVDADGDVDGDDLPGFLEANGYGDNSFTVVTAPVTVIAPEFDGFTIVAGCANDTATYPTGYGGGMYAPYDGAATVRNCTFRGNAAVISGGGMCNAHFSRTTVVNCVFSGNAATYSGGGLCNWRWSIPTAAGCMFAGNAAREGGGLGSASTGLVLSDSMFSGNVAVEGGGIHITLSEPQVSNCTFSNNIAASSGGGMYCTAASPTVTNSVLWDDSPDGLFNGPDCTPTVSYSDVQGGDGEPWFGTGCIDIDPLFVDPDGPDDIPGTDDDDVRLSAGSPCIDAGDNAFVDACSLDADGHQRRWDDPGTADTGAGVAPIVDMGPYEYGSPIAADCNINGVLDACDIEDGTSEDCTGNGMPDECEVDCDSNGRADTCDMLDGTTADCNSNSVPDLCDVLAGTDPDCNGNGSPDECDVVDGSSGDCNSNGVPDECDVPLGNSPDCNANMLPDECETDCNSTGQPDDCDIAAGTSEDLDTNGIPDECECPIIAEPLQTPTGEAGYPKSRYISFAPGDPGEYTALRVTLLDLPAPFDIHNGTKMWVGEPITKVSENAGKIDPADAPGYGTFWSARLSCDPPIYRDDWSTKSPLHVYSDAIVPG